MELKDNKLYLTQEEYKLVKQYNVAASPYMAGLYLYHALKRKGIEKPWDAIYYKDIYMAYRKKNYEILEEEPCDNGKSNE